MLLSKEACMPLEKFRFPFHPFKFTGFLQTKEHMKRKIVLLVEYFRTMFRVLKGEASGFLSDCIGILPGSHLSGITSNSNSLWKRLFQGGDFGEESASRLPSSSAFSWLHAFAHCYEGQTVMLTGLWSAVGHTFLQRSSRSQNVICQDVTRAWAQAFCRAATRQWWR